MRDARSIGGAGGSRIRAGVPSRLSWPSTPSTAKFWSSSATMLRNDVGRGKRPGQFGHSSIAVTNDTYLHLMPQVTKRTAEIMDNFLRAPGEESEEQS